MLIAILVLSAMSFAINAVFISLFAVGMIIDEKEKREAHKRASRKNDEKIINFESKR